MQLRKTYQLECAESAEVNKVAEETILLHNIHIYNLPDAVFDSVIRGEIRQSNFLKKLVMYNKS